MRIEQLKYFVKIVECGSFNKAAEELFLTQPAVTAAIKALETELNLKLLMRQNKGVLPTPIGEQVYIDSKRLLVQIDLAIDGWKKRHAELSSSGIVRVSAIPTICAFIAGCLLPQFLKSHPDISIILEECDLMRFDDCLEKRDRHLLLTAPPLKDEARSIIRWERRGYQAAPLMDDEYVIVLNSGHPLATKVALDQTDCRTIDYCTYSRDDTTKKSPVTSFLETMNKKPAIFLSSLQTITSTLLLNPYGALLLNNMMRFNRSVNSGSLVLKPYAHGPILPSRHYLVHLPHHMLSCAERTFMEYLQINYAKESE